MKRKDFEDFHNDFSRINLSAPSPKTRRLDVDLLPIANEDSTCSVLQGFDQMLSQEKHFAGSTTVQTDVLPVNTFPLDDACNEKALVLYNPTQTMFFKSPTSAEFSIIINSDLIPGLKDNLFALGNSKSLRSSKEDDCNEKTADSLNDSLAVVPWFASHHPMAPRPEPQVVDSLEPMEAEGTEMMDTEDNFVNCMGGSDFNFDKMMEGTGRLQNWPQQQQLCMMPPLIQNTYTPISW